MEQGHRYSKVFVQKGNDLPAMIRSCADEGLRAVICPGDRVLLKPNLNGIDLVGRRISVDAQAIAEVARILHEAGAREILVAENLERQKPTMQLYRESGLDKLAELPGVKLVALEEYPYRSVQPANSLLGQPLQFSALVLDCDKLICLTNLKSHHQANFTGALKNQYTFLSRELKSQYHRGDLECAIVDINLVRKPDYVVVDGMIAQEGLGPRRGRSVHLGVAMAGSDPVAVDAVACQLLGVNPAHIRYLNWAAEKGLGRADPAAIEYDGPAIASLRMPVMTNVDHINAVLEGHARVVATVPCSGCIGAAVTALHLAVFRFGKEPSDLHGLTVAVGPLPQGMRDGLVYQVSHGPEWPDGTNPCRPHQPPTIDAIWDGIARILQRGDDIGLRHF